MHRLPILFVALLASSLAAAPPPEWVQELTPGTAGTHRHVPPCKLTFDIGWSHVVTAGQATLTVREAGDYWRADATAASTGLARMLWKYDCEMTSIMHRKDLRARYLQHRALSTPRPLAFLQMRGDAAHDIIRTVARLPKSCSHFFPTRASGRTRNAGR